MDTYEISSGDLSLYTIIGDPISQARSPYLFNDLLRQRHLDRHLMIPLHVPATGLAAVLRGLRESKNFIGSIITMPHKETCLDLLDDLLPEAVQVGACNVIRREATGRLVGTMLDGEGFIAGLRARGYEVAGHRVFLAGAGGAASGIAHALAKHGAAAITLYNRTLARADKLAQAVMAHRPNIFVSVTDDPSPRGHDIIINGTSLGMKDTDLPPLDLGGLDPTMLVADVVIRRDHTALLAEASRRGCKTQDGIHMLLGQIELMLMFMLPGDLS